MKKAVILLVALLALAGCVEYEEELWLNPDGSGKAKLRLVHRSNYANTQEILRKAQLPGIHLIDSKVAKVGPDVVYSVTFKFKDLESFNNVNDRIGAADFWGKITLNQEPDGNLILRRRIALGNQEEEDDFERLFSSQQTIHPTWNYILHVPWKILATNADPGNVDYKARTIKWSYDTKQMWNRYETMTVQMKKGYPWFVYLVVVAVLILLGFFVIWMIRIARRSHLMDWLIHRERHLEEKSSEENKTVK
jgi:hypothetical protein